MSGEAGIITSGKRWLIKLGEPRLWGIRGRTYFCTGTQSNTRTCRKIIMNPLITPILGNLIYIGGGSLGLILLIVIIVLAVRR